jgi:hypothetical protein
MVLGLKTAMCERCEAWENVIGNWFGESLLVKLEEYVQLRVENMQPPLSESYNAQQIHT